MANALAVEAALVLRISSVVSVPANGSDTRRMRIRGRHSSARKCNPPRVPEDSASFQPLKVRQQVTDLLAAQRAQQAFGHERKLLPFHRHGLAPVDSDFRAAGVP